MHSATYTGKSRPARNGRPALRCGTVVLVIEERGSKSIVVAGPHYDATFGFRYSIPTTSLVR